VFECTKLCVMTSKLILLVVVTVVALAVGGMRLSSTKSSTPMHFSGKFERELYCDELPFDLQKVILPKGYNFVRVIDTEGKPQFVVTGRDSLQKGEIISFILHQNYFIEKKR
jgi:hypothetical protein